MVLHFTVVKLTWKAPLLLSQPHCPRKYLFSRLVASRKVQPIIVLNHITSAVLSHAKDGLRRTQNRLTWTTISHIPPINLSSLAQARCCLKWLWCLATRQTHSPLTMGHQHDPPYGVPAYIPVSTYPPHVPPVTHMYHPGPPPLSSHQSTSSQSQQSVARMVTQGTSHCSDPSYTGHGTQHGYYPYYPTPPPPPHGYSPYQWPAYSRYLPQPTALASRQLLLLSINTEEMVEFLVDKEKRRDHLKFSSTTF